MGSLVGGAGARLHLAGAGLGLGPARAARSSCSILGGDRRLQRGPAARRLRFDAGMPLALITLAVSARCPPCSWTSYRSPSGGSCAGEDRPRGQPGQRRRLRLGGLAASLLLRRQAPARPGRAAVAAARRRRHVLRELRRSARHLRAAVSRAARSRSLPRMFVDTIPPALSMVTLAAFTAVLSARSGVAALAVFALIAVLPQTALTYARARARSPARSADGDAPLLARAGAAPRAGPRASAGTSPGSPSSPSSAAPTPATRSPTPARPSATPRRASWEAGHVGEWWNGGGGPAGLRGPVTPVTSRIVAVADTWSALTAKRRPAALARRGAGGARERRRHALRPARRPGRARRRGRGARVGRRAGPGAAPAPAAPPGAAAPRHRRRVLPTIASTSLRGALPRELAARSRPSARSRSRSA